MANQGRAKKQVKVGTGKVTPLEVAFIVDCYLSDNNYSKTLSSFRSEASDLISRTRGGFIVPERMMGLAGILEDYARLKDHLKEQRLIMDREKQKIETAMKGMLELIRVYHSETAEGISVPISTSPPQIMASLAVPFFSGSNPTNPANPNNMMHVPSICNNSKPPLLPPKSGDGRFSTPTYTQPSTEKRTASKSSAKEPPSAKKPRTPSPRVSNIEQGVGLGSQETSKSSNIGHNKGKRPIPVSTSDDNSTTTQSSIQGSSVVKKLFRHPEGFQQPDTSSPKTPPQALTSQMDKSVSPLENSTLKAVDTTNSFPNVTTSSSCSLISSSETIIISPLKQKGYYAVERSFQVTCSPPIKTCPPLKLGKREHVKGRLDFDRADDAYESMEKPCTPVDNSSSSPSDVETPVNFDFDLPDFEMFDGDFLSGLLVDIGDHNGAFSSCHTESTCILSGADECGGGLINLPDYSVSAAAAGASSECIGLQGYTTILEEVLMV